MKDIQAGLEFIKDVIKVYVDDEKKCNHMQGLIDRAIQAIPAMRRYDYGVGDEPGEGEYHAFTKRDGIYRGVKPVYRTSEYFGGPKTLWVDVRDCKHRWSEDYFILIGPAPEPKLEDYPKGGSES